MLKQRMRGRGMSIEWVNCLNIKCSGAASQITGCGWTVHVNQVAAVTLGSRLRIFALIVPKGNLGRVFGAFDRCEKYGNIKLL